MNDPRIALVHDALVNTGGAERTVTYMCEAFPDAPVFTSVYLPERTYPVFRTRDVRTLSGSNLVHTERRFKQLFPLWVVGFRRLDLSDFDIVLSSTTFGAKYISPPSRTLHACYCYAPFRLLWNLEVYSSDSLAVGWPLNALANLLLPFFRRLDFRVMQGIPRIATSCQNVATRIRMCYQREASIISPPIRLSDYRVGMAKGNYYLTVSRLISHKRVDLVIKACQCLGRPLVVVGDGPEKQNLQTLAGQDVKFVGLVADNVLKELYANCRALIFASHEDYGLVPLEAQASGRPVIAYGAGGILETAIENETGIFFREQTVEALIKAILAFEKMRFDPLMIRQTVQRFDAEHFKQKLRNFVLQV